MKKITKPAFTTEDVYTSCISNMNGNLRKYWQALPTIIEYAKDYNLKMESKEAHLLQPHDKITNDVGKDEMTKLYDQKLARSGQPARAYYDKIIISAPNGICPLCGIGHVSTLDHYLAKSLYPSLAVTPENLIPACRDCNNSKSTTDFKLYEDMTLHPYYDHFDEVEWLEAEIVSLIPTRVTYHVSCAINDSEMKTRFEHHLDVFEFARCKMKLRI